MWGGATDEGALESAVATENVWDGSALETIVLRVGRPVLEVAHDVPVLEFRDAESEVWRQRLVEARDHLVDGVKAVGRVEVVGHPQLDWIGTGWLVDEDIVITNRHVAREFGRANGDGFVFKRAITGGTMQPSIDFLEEFGRSDSLEFAIERILHIEGDDGPDLALLKLARTRGASLARPISLSGSTAKPDQMIAVVGYPAKDSRIPDQKLMEDIFGDVFNKKRLAPGQITGSDSGVVFHDCSTLGGNSGSVVMDLETGDSVGLHFAGRFLEKNFAVDAAAIAERLHRVVKGRRRAVREEADTYAKPATNGGAPAPVPTSIDHSVRISAGTTSVTIPIRVTIDIGKAVAGDGVVVVTPDEDTESEEGFADEEARVEDYSDRKGYNSVFLGSGQAVSLPKVVGAANDILTFDNNGRKASELRYQHFSVVMSKQRRLCFFSAVNIDGAKSKKVKRTGWLLDPRIPKTAQIKGECYGNVPKFSRGHMTRREDPVWGTVNEASRGNSDSMHVTNTVPQMQTFNAGIWLGLEDYALDHARDDDMRISVFTGPFLRGDDPVQFGVKIPRSFWKVIAFVHDQTNKLCATGYTLSQEDFLREEEFVFGTHKTAQVPIASIERDAGVSFGTLAQLDPLRGQEEAVFGDLSDFEQIRFVID